MSRQLVLVNPNRRRASRFAPCRPVGGAHSRLSVHSEAQLGDDEERGERLHRLLELGLQGGAEGQERQVRQRLCRVHRTTHNQGKPPPEDHSTMFHC